MNRVEEAGALSAYRRCAEISATHGRTYFLAARLLSPDRRRAVHALYAFARHVDDIVDGQAKDAALQLDLIEKRLRERLDMRDPGHPGDPILFAVSHTILRYDIAPEHFWTFLDAMRMDVPGSALFRNRYATMTDLRQYMRGSAAAIGLQLLPVLGTVVPLHEAEPAAAALGEAFQLTNFLRDIAEDLDRNRIYLPIEALSAFDVDEPLLAHCHHTGITAPRLRRALAHLIAVNRDLYRRADTGMAQLDPRVRPAIRTAAILYAGILEEIERSDFAVFSHRAVVPTRRRLLIAAREFAKGARYPRRPALGA
ncbi:phytoene/squalene synthase family protein [Nocardia pseudobrasiliensis]|uniref:Phytoene synthase n=1 Tax=Nocardia pseudobrasiliensis TaxID=45979 RepID=A0A370I3I4_9NOCA|nr:phytoene/squalene synthase family protein [Nocardia pseudobrasiliensis]RDI65297.1 phytoene synthase [Nocardia pseudobrasiliensis]